MERRVIAEIEVNDDKAFETIDDGPVAYLEQRMKPLIADEIKMVNCVLIDEENNDNPWEVYCGFLVAWGMEHSGCLCKDNHVSPPTFEVWQEDPDYWYSQL